MKIGIIIQEITYKVEDESKIKVIVIRYNNKIIKAVGSIIVIDENKETFTLNSLIMMRIIEDIIIMKMKKRFDTIIINIYIRIDGNRSFIIT